MKIIISLCVILVVAGLSEAAYNTTYGVLFRSFIKNIAARARKGNSNIQVLVNGGAALAYINEDDGSNSAIDTSYLSSINGVLTESLFFGGSGVSDSKTDKDDTNWMLPQLIRAKNQGVVAMNIDYCAKTANVQTSKQLNAQYGLLDFQGDRSLQNIPSGDVKNQNSNNINKLSDAKNIGWFINPDDQDTYVSQLSKTKYDAIVIAAFTGETYDEHLTPAQMTKLKTKPQGGRRQVYCYMSAGEASKWMYYWNRSWGTCKGFIEKENLDFPGSYKVLYWDPAWQDVIYKQTDSLIGFGCDGVFLDVCDASYFAESGVHCSNKGK